MITKKRFITLVSLTISMLCMWIQPLCAYDTISAYMSDFDPTRTNDMSRSRLLLQYDITIEADEDDKRDLSLIIKKHSTSEVLDAEVEFTVFDEQKVIWLESFLPNFPRKGARGSGKELLKYLFNKNTYPGYTIISHSSNNNDTKRFYLKEAVEGTGYYKEIYSPVGDEGSKESFDIVRYRWNHTLLSHDHGRHFLKDMNLVFRVPEAAPSEAEYTVQDLDEEYDITPSNDKVMDRSLNSLRIYDKERKAYLNTVIQYYVFSEHKIIYLYNFIPEFVGAGRPGRGRALLKKLFNDTNGFAGFTVFCPLDINERRQRYLLQDAVKKMNYYRHVYSTFEIGRAHV